MNSDIILFALFQVTSAQGVDTSLDSDMHNFQVLVGPDEHAERESIQGTFSVVHSGDYVLRWQMQLPPTAQSGGAMLTAPLSDRRSKLTQLMYHSEVINPLR